jgi:hypothetical protein
MFVAERNRLVTRHLHAGHVGRQVDLCHSPNQANQQKDRESDTRSGDRIRSWMKELSHSSSGPAIPPCTRPVSTRDEYNQADIPQKSAADRREVGYSYTRTRSGEENCYCFRPAFYNAGEFVFVFDTRQLHLRFTNNRFVRAHIG